MKPAIGFHTGTLASDNLAGLSFRCDKQVPLESHYSCDLQTNSVITNHQKSTLLSMPFNNTYLTLICMPRTVLSALQVITYLIRLCL